MPNVGANQPNTFDFHVDTWRWGPSVPQKPQHYQDTLSGSQIGLFEPYLGASVPNLEAVDLYPGAFERDLGANAPNPMASASEPTLGAFASEHYLLAPEPSAFAADVVPGFGLVDPPGVVAPSVFDTKHVDQPKRRSSDPDWDIYNTGRHICALCGKSYGRKPELARHLRTHFGIKRFVCVGGCNGAFDRSEELEQHYPCGPRHLWILNATRASFEARREELRQRELADLRRLRLPPYQLKLFVDTVPQINLHAST